MEQQELVVQTPKKLEVGIQKETTKEESTVDPALDKQANELVEQLLSVDPKELREQERHAKAIGQLGGAIQKEISRRSAMLRQPMTKLVNDAEDGGPVAQSLLSLQEKTNEINPNRVDFSMGTLARLLAKIPGVGTPISRWFAKYQDVDAVIQDIIKSLEDGRAQLERDNTTLREDQIAMRELTFKLQDYIQLAQLIDEKMTKVVEGLAQDDQRRSFLEEEILFPLRQRIMDLQQQLAVNQQGVLTTEVIIRNNKELIRGVTRSLSVTTTALSIAATLALALQTQKNVLKGVEAVTKTTDDLIAQTANKLKTQGAEIHKQAASAQLDIEKLKTAFQDVQAALDDISTFRRNALPQMANSIIEMDKVTTDMESSIQKLEKGDEKLEDPLLIEIVDQA